MSTPADLITITRAQYAAGLRLAAANALINAAAAWAADPDSVGDSDKDARNWLRDRAELARHGEVQ